MDASKKSLTDQQIWDMMEEKYRCEDCLNYEYYDEEVGYQCRYAFCPPCEITNNN